MSVQELYGVSLLVLLGGGLACLLVDCFYRPATGPLAVLCSAVALLAAVLTLTQPLNLSWSILGLPLAGMFRLSDFTAALNILALFFACVIILYSISYFSRGSAEASLRLAQGGEQRRTANQDSAACPVPTRWNEACPITPNLAYRSSAIKGAFAHGCPHSLHTPRGSRPRGLLRTKPLPGRGATAPARSARAILHCPAIMARSAPLFCQQPVARSAPAGDWGDWGGGLGSNLNYSHLL